MMYMVQFSATGRFLRKAKLNMAVWQIWAKQLPHCPIELVRVQ